MLTAAVTVTTAVTVTVTVTAPTPAATSALAAVSPTSSAVADGLDQPDYNEDDGKENERIPAPMPNKGACVACC
jgi:hypothetical protein